MIVSFVVDGLLSVMRRMLLVLEMFLLNYQEISGICFVEF